MGKESERWGEKERDIGRVKERKREMDRVSWRRGDGEGDRER